MNDNSLITWLLKYSAMFNEPFLLGKVKYLDSIEIKRRIKLCIDSNNLYNIQIFKLDLMQKMSENDIEGR